MRSVPSRRTRRAILIYAATVVAPLSLLLWLGLQSFERQREAVEQLTREKIGATVGQATLAAAAEALGNRSHPMIEHVFVVEGGHVKEPVLYPPLPRTAPAALVEAERLEFAGGRPNLALARFRSLAGSSDANVAALAIHGVARCLSRLGRHKDARDAWHRLARTHPAAMDLSGRPYGIVAAIQAGETDGLYDAIALGRWNIPEDQAEYFLRTLAPDNPVPTLERYAFARLVEADFRPSSKLGATEEVGRAELGGRQIYYRTSGRRTLGFSVDPAWLAETEARVAADERRSNDDGPTVTFYAAAMAALLLVVSAGVVVLHRDTSREARLTEVRADFVNGVAHELKTPVSIMRLYADTLIRQGHLPGDERRAFYRVIGRESARLGRLVDQVLAFSRVDRGDMRHDLQPGDLAVHVAGIMDDCSGWLEHAGFTVRSEIPASSPLVAFDPAAVTQAVVNLVDNAAKYSGTVRRIEVRLTSDAGEVSLEVKDQGVGVPAEQQSKIFDRFYRASNGAGKGGYGLGLFMVRDVMTAHGGHVTVRSTPGAGSTFRLTFPVLRP